MKNNQQQQAAIEAMNHKILVAASAGTGKTTVLVQRIKHLIDTDQVALDRLLVVTFTRAAAENMRERLRAVFRQDPVQYAEQLKQLPEMEITTIDAFTQHFVQRHTDLIGWDPEFQVLPDDSASARLRSLAWAATAEELYPKDLSDNGDAAKEKLLQLMGEHPERRFAQLDKMVSSLKDDEGWIDRNFKIDEEANYKQGQEIILRWIDDLISRQSSYVEARKIFEDYANDSSAAITKGIQPDLESQESLQNYSKGLIESVKDFKALSVSSQAWIQAIERIHDGLDVNRWVKANDQAKIKKADFTKASRKAKILKECPPEVLGKLDQAYEGLYDVAVQTGELKSWSLKIPEISTGEEQDNLATLKEAFTAYRKHYQELKQANNSYEYSDVTRQTMAILKGHAQLRQSVQEHYQEVMIDEYQDTSGLQDALLQLIGERGRVFMVGDVKQSIYRFRNADPSIFQKKARDYSTDPEAEFRMITLQENYRSRPEILAAVNTVFEQLMTGKPTGGGETELQYQGQELVAGNQQLKEADFSADLPPVQIQRVGDEPASSPYWVAQKIRQLVDNKTKVFNPKAGGFRSVRYSDIGIVTRTWTGSADYLKALQDQGIPYTVSRSSQFLQKWEVQIVAAYLKILNNHRDNISLVAVLRSPLYRVTEPELAFLHLQPQQRNGFWGPVHEVSQSKFVPDQELVQAMGAEFDLKALQDKLQSFRTDYQTIEKFVNLVTNAELLQRLYDQTNLPAVMAALPFGESRRANLYGLINYAETIAETTVPSLGALIAYLDQTAELDEITQSDDGNAVTFMTIHGSKGLEYPIVMLVNAAAKATDGKSSQAFNGMLFGRQGLALKALGTKKVAESEVTLLTDNDTERLKMLRNAIQADGLEEAKRLLYVAMTRAKQELIVVARNKSASKSSTRKKDSAPTFLKWLAPLEEQYGSDEVAQPEAGQEPLPAQAISKTATDTLANVTVIPAREYAHPDESGLAVSSGVTDVKGALVDDTVLKLLPGPSLEEEASSDVSVRADELGTAVHLVFERVPLDVQVTEEVAQATMEQLGTQKLITPEVLDAMKAMHLAESLTHFFAAPLGQRMLAAYQAEPSRVQREAPFTTLVSAAQFLDGEGEADQVVVHGIIDAYFWDATQNGYVIIDYKTDLGLDEQKVQSEKYAGQLNLYRQALAMMTGQPVAQAALYGVRKGQFYGLNY